MVKASVVILNWNGENFLRSYIPTLASETPRAEIVVADNGSTDGSIQWLKENWPQVRIISFDRNYGFTGGYNRALEQIEAEYFMLLNSDVRVSQGWLDSLIDFMDNTPDAGICMPKILKEPLPQGTKRSRAMRFKDSSENEKFEYAGACGGFIDRFGYPFCRGRILNELETDKGQYDSALEVFWASGAAFFIRSSVWRALNGFDPRFFAHMEEIDLCWRAKLLGYEVWAVPQSRVYHVGGGTLPNESPFKLYLNYRNNLLMLHKNLPAKEKRRVIVIRMLMDAASAMIYLLTSRRRLFISVLKAHRDFKRMRRIFEPSPRVIGATNSTFKRIGGVWNGSIILAYFTGRRRFTSLKF